ncbi:MULTISPECIES: flavodoxin [unclassified Clostridium]|uniref:flavodoxin n=1 Tax=unclassified Clostridium TaxID=2614128 RepID=UPI0002983BAE|nr:MULTISPECIES: flavodoxin [unclassified Clostridium]EKQ57113.1 MAG: putative NADPH-quinone reductase (modulator of drug activity B) [Clostridium sp. Maddingley MBC34-26]
MSNTLIAFFSMTGESYVGGKIVNLEVGNTNVAAQIIGAMIVADTFQIETVQNYPEGHMNLINYAKEELNQNARPELKTKVDNMEQYDTIILGYPNWWGTCPMPVFTFLESYDFSDKRILPLCTNEGSGLSFSVTDIKKTCPDANVEDGLAIIGGRVKDSRVTIENWLKKQKLL